MASSKGKDPATKVKDDRNLGDRTSEWQRRYEQLTSRNLAAVFKTNIAGRFIECNNSLALMLGYASADELMQVPVMELYPDRTERQRFIETLLAKGQLVNYEVQLNHRSGRTVHLLENVFVDMADGKASVIEGTAIDISAIRAAEQEQRILLNNYRQLADRARDGILLVRKGIVEYANQAAHDLLGISTMTGKPFVELLQREDQGPVSALIDGLTGEQEAGPLSILSQALGRHSIQLFAMGTRHMGGPSVQVSLRDVEGEQAALRDQLRVKMAEEVNEILRTEIAEHRRTQEALRQSRRFARSLIDSSLDMIIAVDKENRISEFNPAAMIKFGYETEEVLGKNTGLLYADKDEFARIEKELVQHGAFAGEVRNLTRTGDQFTCFLAASRLYDEDGHLLGSMSVSRDITREKADKEALRSSEERYRDLFENATDLIQSVDTEGRFIYVNKAHMATLGYSEEELRDLTLMDLVEPGVAERTRRWLKGGPLPDDVDPWRMVFISKDGRRLMMEGSSTFRFEEDRPVAVRSIFRDITAVHEAEVKLRQHAAKEKALFDTSEHMFWTVDRRTALTSFNKGYSEMIQRLYGRPPQLSTDPSAPKDLFAPMTYHRYWEEKYAEVFAGKAVRFETDLTDRNGDRVCNEVFISPVFDHKGRVVEAFGIGHEITAVKETKEKVQEQEARLKAIFESSAHTMIWTLGKGAVLTSFNEHFQTVMLQGLGMRCKLGDEVMARLLSHASDDMRDRVMRKIKGAFQGNPQQFEIGLDRKGGGLFWVQCFVNPIVVEDEVEEVSCLAYDITERKETEGAVLENLREKEVLLKEVHHRVKNNLQIISSIFNLQKDHVDGDARSLALLHEGQNRIRSMAFIHESLYQSKSFSQVDMGSYIGGLGRNLMMSYSLTGRIRLETKLEKVLLDLDRAIPCGLILNELISNALKHGYPADEEGVVSIELDTSKDKVHITVMDDGKGLPADFTPGLSSGLGMELVNMLVDQLDGDLQLRSRPGQKGTSYLLTFERH
jgi:PAS domain S-box-containing protein